MSFEKPERVNENPYRSRSNQRYDKRNNGYHLESNASRSDQKPIVKEKPNFKPSGLLAKDSNSVAGIALKYTPPQDSSSPPSSPTYYLYSFQEGAKIPKIHQLIKGHYLIGRDRKVADITTDHESCSKQHAVIQFRERPTVDTEGRKTTEIKPFIIDLESINGTVLNDEEIPTSRYIELKNEDVLRFGDSTTDNVLIVS